MSYRGSTPGLGVDLDTGWVWPLVAVTIAGYEYPSTKITPAYRGPTHGVDHGKRRVRLAYRGSTHGVDLDTGWVRQLAAMTIAGYEYPSNEVKANLP